MLRFIEVRKGFTLAEVLITLGIIGVVAAMTMPTLMNSTQGAQYKTALKKVISSVSQGITMNYAIKEYDFASAVTETAVDSVATAQSVGYMLSSRMNLEVYSNADLVDTTVYTLPTAQSYSDIEGDGTFTATTAANLAKYTSLLFADGTMFYYPYTSAACVESDPETTATTGLCLGFVDVNGAKGPNKIVGCDSATSTTSEAGDTTTSSCVVSSPADIYPVIFYDQIIKPYTAAGKAVLYN
ncbi:MAG: type II secretion system protein [Candidatus Gastranaerophilales bacterium]